MIQILEIIVQLKDAAFKLVQVAHAMAQVRGHKAQC